MKETGPQIFIAMKRSRDFAQFLSYHLRSYMKKKIGWKVFEKSPVKNNCSMFKITASIRNNMKTMSYVGNGRL